MLGIAHRPPPNAPSDILALNSSPENDSDEAIDLADSVPANNTEPVQSVPHYTIEIPAAGSEYDGESDDDEDDREELQRLYSNGHGSHGPVLPGMIAEFNANFFDVSGDSEAISSDSDGYAAMPSMSLNFNLYNALNSYGKRVHGYDDEEEDVPPRKYPRVQNETPMLSNLMPLLM